METRDYPWRQRTRRSERKMRAMHKVLLAAFKSNSHSTYTEQLDNHCMDSIQQPRGKSRA